MYIGNLDPIFGKNLRYLRRLTHMSQQTLAALVGISEDDIGRMEASEGFIELDSKILERFCTIFCVTANDLTSVDLEGVAFLFPRAAGCRPYR